MSAIIYEDRQIAEDVAVRYKDKIRYCEWIEKEYYHTIKRKEWIVYDVKSKTWIIDNTFQVVRYIYDVIDDIEFCQDISTFLKYSKYENIKNIIEMLKFCEGITISYEVLENEYLTQE